MERSENQIRECIKEKPFSPNEAFKKLLTRKFSSCKKPCLSRPNADHLRKTKYCVEIRLIFIRIGEIDSTRETFFAETLMQASWLDPDATVETFKREQSWNPEIIVEVSSEISGF